MALSEVQERILAALEAGPVEDALGAAQRVLKSRVRYDGDADGLMANVLLLRDRRLLHVGRSRTRGCWYIGLTPAPPAPPTPPAATTPTSESRPPVRHGLTPEETAEHRESALRAQDDELPAWVVDALLRRDLGRDALHDVLRRRSLSVGQVVDLVADIRLAEREAPDTAPMSSPEARRAVTRLYLVGVSACDVARLVDLPAEDVMRFIGRRQLRQSRGILHLHQRGLTPAQIRHVLGLRSTEAPRRVLRLCGQAPNRVQRPRLSDSQRRRVRRLRAKGMTLEVIASTMEVGLDQVKRVLYRR